MTGLVQFIITAASVLVALELTLFVEEFLKVRAEFRRGFLSGRTFFRRILSRHALKVLRLEGDMALQIKSALRCLWILVLLGLLPGITGEAPLPMSHSLWVFFSVVLLSALFDLFLDWVVQESSSSVLALHLSERVLNAMTALCLLGLTVVTLTGVDTFSDLHKMQTDGHWLIFLRPVSIFLMFTFSVLGVFLSGQTVFSRPDQQVPEKGWTLSDLVPQLRRLAWGLFIVDVFLGGRSLDGISGIGFFMAKWVLVTVIVSLIAQLFFQLREDQAERFLLWRLTPASVMILLLTLLWPK